MGRALRALARLAPPPTPEGGEWSIPLDWFEWLPAGSAPFMAARFFFTAGPPFGSSFSYTGIPPRRVPAEVDKLAPCLTIDAASGTRLAHVDELRPDSSSLRVGWLFLAGTTDDPSGGRRQVFQPLLARVVRIRRNTAGFPVSHEIVPVDDARATPLVGDRDERWGIEHAIEVGGGALVSEGPAIAPALLRRLDRLNGYARRAATAAGFPDAAVAPADAPPEVLRDRKGVAVVAGLAVYAVHATPAVGTATSLRAWSVADLRPRTSFHTLYGYAEGSAGDHPAPGPVHGSIPLAPSQQNAVAHSRTAPVTVVTGAPGNGKSTTITAIAGDAVARGASVLVATASGAAVDALAELFERAPADGGPHRARRRARPTPARRARRRTRAGAGTVRAHDRPRRDRRARRRGPRRTPPHVDAPTRRSRQPQARRAARHRPRGRRRRGVAAPGPACQSGCSLRRVRGPDVRCRSR